MLPSLPKVNTYVKTDVDPISKIFIRVEAMFALNRLPIIQELSGAKRFILFFYNIILMIAIVASISLVAKYNELQVPTLDILEYLFCVIFSFMTRKRLGSYFDEINGFDVIAGSRPRTREFLKRNIILHAIFVLVTVSLIFCVYVGSIKIAVPILTVRLCHFIELYFYGHLFSLINPRLGLINFHMEASLCNKYETPKELKRFRLYSRDALKNNNCEIESLMELYQRIMSAYDSLIDAIEWQFLVMLSISFMSTLSVSYEHALLFLGQDEVSAWRLAAFISLLVGNTFSLFAPCIYCDQLHGEVRRLRTLLASRLYENKLDKFKRSVARAMLALTEEHDLSLSLLGMLKIDISLPLKFTSLLLTYLIILLQFQKVINI